METGTETRTAKKRRRGRNGDRNDERGGRRERVGQRGTGSKKSPLVEVVLE